jgi:hypothetical protein
VHWFFLVNWWWLVDDVWGIFFAIHGISPCSAHSLVELAKELPVETEAAVFMARSRLFFRCRLDPLEIYREDGWAGEAHEKSPMVRLVDGPGWRGPFRSNLISPRIRALCSRTPVNNGASSRAAVLLPQRRPSAATPRTGTFCFPVRWRAVPELQEAVHVSPGDPHGRRRRRRGLRWRRPPVARALAAVADRVKSHPNVSSVSRAAIIVSLELGVTVSCISSY